MANITVSWSEVGSELTLTVMDSRPHLFHNFIQTLKMLRIETTQNVDMLQNTNPNGSRSSLFPMMDRPLVATSLDPVRDSTKPLDGEDLTTVGICRPAGGKPMPRRPASRHFTVAGNGRLVRASFCNCETTHNIFLVTIFKQTVHGL